MSGHQLENCWAIHSHMNQPREKHRHLGASLLLTSSFAHHKQQLSRQKKQRMEQKASSHASYYQQVLQAKRINQTRDVDPHFQSYAHPFSSLDELKRHAKKLMDEQTTKLGKENEPATPIQSRTTTPAGEHTDSFSAFKQSKKPNKRRIVKGRPEMYAVTRRRAFILNILDQERSNSQKGVNNQLLNKNNLLKFISTQNDKAEAHNLYDNLERHKTLEEVSIPKKNIHEYRKSLINFSESGRGKLQQVRRNMIDGEKEALKGQVFNLSRQRYSSIKTID